MTKETVKRRHLSGIYLFDTLEGEERRQPTCFEDCTEKKQDEWLESLTPEALRNLAKQLGQSLRAIGDHFDIARKDDEEES